MIDCDVIVWLGLLPQPVKAKKECRQNKWLNFSLSLGKGGGKGERRADSELMGIGESHPTKPRPAIP